MARCSIKTSSGGHLPPRKSYPGNGNGTICPPSPPPPPPPSPSVTRSRSTLDVKHGRGGGSKHKHSKYSLSLAFLETQEPCKHGMLLGRAFESWWKRSVFGLLCTNTNTVNPCLCLLFTVYHVGALPVKNLRSRVAPAARGGRTLHPTNLDVPELHRVAARRRTSR